MQKVKRRRRRTSFLPVAVVAAGLLLPSLLREIDDVIAGTGTTSGVPGAERWRRWSLATQSCMIRSAASAASRLLSTSRWTSAFGSRTRSRTAPPSGPGGGLHGRRRRARGGRRRRQRRRHVRRRPPRQHQALQPLPGAVGERAGPRALGGAPPRVGGGGGGGQPGDLDEEVELPGLERCVRVERARADAEAAHLVGLEEVVARVATQRVGGGGGRANAIIFAKTPLRDVFTETPRNPNPNPTTLLPVTLSLPLSSLPPSFSPCSPPYRRLSPTLLPTAAAPYYPQSPPAPAVSRSSAREGSGAPFLHPSTPRRSSAPTLLRPTTPRSSSARPHASPPRISGPRLRRSPAPPRAVMPSPRPARALCTRLRAGSGDGRQGIGVGRPRIAWAEEVGICMSSSRPAPPTSNAPASDNAIYSWITDGISKKVVAICMSAVLHKTVKLSEDLSCVVIRMHQSRAVCRIGVYNGGIGNCIHVWRRFLKMPIHQQNFVILKAV
ncbi:hypothetical protein SETIT_6G155000v2 [Setaria italica]|uniref:Uncharacterized protein n=1 Tax=Setaria italica TaxID=4555 RepID=A0A368RLX2_SETIT|nr:hypothetical protein SETIT_6G155000v2 [Setaria italica]